MQSCSIAEVLQVVVQHIESTELQLFLCSASPVCQDWHAAVLSLGTRCAQCLDVTIELDDYSHAAFLSNISSFISWLQHHAGLVHSINILQRQDYAEDYISQTWPAQEFLAAALTAASNIDSSTSDSAQPLQLQAYSSNCMGGGALLQALVSAHLTSLHVSLPQHSRTDPTLPSCQDLASAFERLSNLQSLSLFFKLKQSVSEACCRALACLTQLTDLNLRVGLTAKTVAAVQDALPQLPLQCLQLNCAYESWAGWDLRQLTQLTELHLHLPRFTFMQNHHVQLPQQLFIFSIQAHGRLDPFEPTAAGTELEDGQMSSSVLPPLVQNLTDLQHLQAFSSSTYNSLDESVIQLLSQLTTLQDVSLGYDSVLAAAGNSKDWVKLKQLQRLSILWCYHDDLYFGRHQLSNVMEDLGAVTSLTSLWLNVSVQQPSYWLQRGFGAGPGHYGEGPAAPLLVPLTPDAALPLPLDIFSHLTGLSRLQELQVILGPLPGNPAYDDFVTAEHVVQVQMGSAEHLSVLTSLTLLQLDHLGQAVDDDAAVAIAKCLTGLRHLELPGNDIESDDAITALHEMPLLTYLQLDTDEEEEDTDEDSWDDEPPTDVGVDIKNESVEEVSD